MRENATRRGLLIAAAAGFCLSSLPVLLLPWASYDPDRGSVALAYAVGALFWLGLLSGYGAFILLASRVRKSEAERPTPAGRYLAERPGFFRLATNGYALAADIALGVAVLVNALTLTGLFRLPAALQYFMIALLLLGLHFHGLFNGRFFWYVKGPAALRTGGGRTENAKD